MMTDAGSLTPLNYACALGDSSQNCHQFVHILCQTVADQLSIIMLATTSDNFETAIMAAALFVFLQGVSHPILMNPYLYS